MLVYGLRRDEEGVSEAKVNGNFKDSGVKSCKVSNVLKVYKMSKSFKNFKHEPEFKNFKGSKSWSKCVKDRFQSVSEQRFQKSVSKQEIQM